MNSIKKLFSYEPSGLMVRASNDRAFFRVFLIKCLKTIFQGLKNRIAETFEIRILMTEIAN